MNTVASIWCRNMLGYMCICPWTLSVPCSSKFSLSLIHLEILEHRFCSKWRILFIHMIVCNHVVLYRWQILSGWGHCHRGQLVSYPYSPVLAAYIPHCILTHLIVRWTKVEQIYLVYSLIACYLETLIKGKKTKMTKKYFETRPIFKQALNLLLGVQNVWTSYMYVCETCTEELTMPRLWVKHLLDFMARKLHRFVFKILKVVCFDKLTCSVWVVWGLSGVRRL